MGNSLYHVYVIELSDEAGKRVDPRKPCVYVGQSVYTPEIRFQQHLAGHRASKVAKKFGLKLKSRLYRNYGPYRTREESLDAEGRLARVLRDRGYTVFGGH